jgi:1-deoxy-D-xylulose-5-phosphate reductoisomerase
MRRVSILGSTGSIGQSTVDLIARRDDLRTVALTGAGNIALLAEQARRLGAELAVTADDDRLDDLRAALSGTGIKVAAGRRAVVEAATRPADWVMSAIVGAAGLEPGLAALRQGATLALANKESLVCAGPLVLAEAARHGATILPVDSEHSAIFQALMGENRSAVERVIITASGGPFRTWPRERMARATLAEAAAHPSWSMGQRISVDSASLFNKAMELIEAREFFGFAPDQIEVVVHPQSIVHAMVGFADGGLMAHLGPADMRHAIGFALHHPARGPVPVARLDLPALARLEFEAPDPERFPALRLSRAVMEAGGLSGAAFNGAKETALDLFIAGAVGFLDMAALVETVLDGLWAEGALGESPASLDNVRVVDHLSRQRTRQAAAARAG